MQRYFTKYKSFRHWLKYFKLECDCNVEGCNGSEVCDGKTGQCACKEAVTGKKCDKCKPGFFDFPECKGM